MIIVMKPPPKVVLPMRKIISVSLVKEGFEDEVGKPSCYCNAYNQSFMQLGLNNKIAMVAGASRGLGFAVARALSREGALVSISSRTQEAADAAAEKIQKQTGRTVLAMACDVRSG